MVELKKHMVIHLNILMNNVKATRFVSLFMVVYTINKDININLVQYYSIIFNIYFPCKFYLQLIL